MRGNRLLVERRCGSERVALGASQSKVFKPNKGFHYVDK